MHYFKRNIGEYHKKAGTMLEHGAYTLLIDSCYDRERFPTKIDAIDWCWARTPEEIAAVSFVLEKFFILEGEFYVQNRISEEIAKYHENAKTNKEIALNREAKRKLKKHDPLENTHEPCTNLHLTKNQEPRTKNQYKDIDATHLTNSSEFGRVPIQPIVDLFNLSFPELPQVQKITAKRKKLILARWNEFTDLQSVESFKKFFRVIRDSDFLMDSEKKWLGFDWIFEQANFLKIYEGNYDNGEQK